MCLVLIPTLISCLNKHQWIFLACEGKYLVKGRKQEQRTAAIAIRIFAPTATTHFYAGKNDVIHDDNILGFHEHPSQTFSSTTRPFPSIPQLSIPYPIFHLFSSVLLKLKK